MATYPNPLSDQAIADQLTRSGNHWAKTTITYSFDDLSTAGNDLNSTYESWIKKAIGQIGEILNLNFVETGSGGDITFNGSSGNGTYASTSYYTLSREIVSSNIFFDRTWSSNQPSALDYGSYGFTTIIHEFLHALGLSHPGDYDAGSGNPSYFPDAEFLQDTHRYSVMSYFGAGSDGSGTSHYFYNGSSFEYQYPQTPMVYDILALTQGGFNGKFGGYSFNTATRSGDTTYGYNPTGGINEVYNFTSNPSPVLTIYDAGGVDTLDLSGDTVSMQANIVYDTNGVPSSYNTVARETSVIDLRPGHYSSTHGMKNNLGISFGTTIENVVATQFNDTIYGNDANNLITGGSGNDVMDGGSGTDTAVFSSARANYTITNNGGTFTVVGPDGTDTLTNFEFLKFADQQVSAADLVAPFGKLMLASPSFGSNAGWTSQEVYTRTTADVNGDGKLDIVGFASGGVNVALGSGGGNFGAAVQATVGLGASAGWANQNTNPRLLADTNGDGRVDIVGFGADGVFVALGRSDGTFAPLTVAANSFGRNAGWDDQEVKTRTLADVNGDGNVDIVGFGAAGTYVALGQGDGTFGTIKKATSDFGTDRGWNNQTEKPRIVTDINGDGRADIVGFGAAGTYVGLGQADGSFAPLILATSRFGRDAGWSDQDVQARILTDINGDGNADIVGFGAAGTYSALGNGDGTFQGLNLATSSFGINAGWANQDNYARLFADVDGDGKVDMVGFGAAGTYVAFGKGDGTFSPLELGTERFGKNAGWTSQETTPRLVTDVNGDGRADILGFGSDGTYLVLANASGQGNAPQYSRDTYLSGGQPLEDTISVVVDHAGIVPQPGSDDRAIGGSLQDLPGVLDDDWFGDAVGSGRFGGAAPANAETTTGLVRPAEMRQPNAVGDGLAKLPGVLADDWFGDAIGGFQSGGFATDTDGPVAVIIEHLQGHDAESAPAFPDQSQAFGWGEGSGVPLSPSVPDPVPATAIVAAEDWADATSHGFF
jgi:hypothetical protein